MITIDEVRSEVSVDGQDRPRRTTGQRSAETQKEALREIVRQLVAEELERYQRTEARR